jgi:hypothetical protein
MHHSVFDFFYVDYSVLLSATCYSHITSYLSVPMKLRILVLRRICAVTVFLFVYASVLSFHVLSSSSVCLCDIFPFELESVNR